MHRDHMIQDRQNKALLRRVRGLNPRAYKSMMREINSNLGHLRRERRVKIVAALLKGGATLAFAVTGAAVANAGFAGAAKASWELASLGYTSYGSPAINTAFGAGISVLTAALICLATITGVTDARNAEASNRAIRAIQVGAAKSRGLVPGG